MENKINIKIEKFNERFMNYRDMESEIEFEVIERLKTKSTLRTIILLYSAILWFVFFGIDITTTELGGLSILIFILCSSIILLYFSIITDIIIPDKLKEIYEKAYSVYGYALNESSATVEIIEEIFFESEEIDDFLAVISSGVVLEKRKCFKCQKIMSFTHFYNNNISEISILQLEKLWKSPHIQLFCCRCYKKELLFKKWRKKPRTIYQS